MSWTSADIERAQGRQKPPQAARTPASRTPVPPAANGAATPPEKHVQLPPPPAEPGPWAVGTWELRRATAYPEVCRLTLVGPPGEFEQLKAYLLAYQP